MKSVRSGLALAVLLCVPRSHVSAQVVDPEVHRAVTAQGRQRVVVSLTSSSTKGETARQRRDLIRLVQGRVLGRLGAEDFEITRRYELVAGFAGTVTASGLAKLAASPEVRRVDLDVGGSGALMDSVSQIGAGVVQDIHGINGTGVTVGVIDSGVDRDHPDLVSSLVDEHCFCFDGGSGCCPDGSTTQEGPGSAEDDVGHGSHVAGIITGDGVVAPRGVAPGASVVAVKVLDSNNLFCCISDVVAAMDWIAAHHPEVKVVNMSLGTNFPNSYSGNCDGTGLGVLFADAVNTLAASGVSVFASSMNNGLTNAMGAPACVANAISVGAVTKSDVVVFFSNSSTTLDLLGPGVNITSSHLAGGTASLSGTSMGAPHAAGTAALLLDASPGLTPAAMLSALSSTGVPILDTRNGLTFPRVDALAALGVVPICGDGAVDAPEECDDDNLVAGDGCDSSCRVEGCFQCSGAPSVCVAAAPRIDCRAAGRGILQVIDAPNPARRKLVWKWLNGAATTHEDLGNPVYGDDYALCVYDRSAGAPARALKARVPFGGTCGSHPCWMQLGSSGDPKGYRYTDGELSPDGVRKLRLKPGTSGKAKMVLLAKGPPLSLPGAFSPTEYFDQDADVVVQLVRRNADPCWESVFPVAATLENSGTRFKAVLP